MKSKTLEVKICQRFDDDSKYPSCQNVECEECNKVNYRVSNYMDDDYIGGDLLSAEGYIDAIKLGMSLAKQGYSKIQVTYADANNEDDGEEDEEDILFKEAKAFLEEVADSDTYTLEGKKEFVSLLFGDDVCARLFN